MSFDIHSLEQCSCTFRSSSLDEASLDYNCVGLCVFLTIDDRCKFFRSCHTCIFDCETNLCESSSSLFECKLLSRVDKDTVWYLSEPKENYDFGIRDDLKIFKLTRKCLLKFDGCLKACGH